jgi:hypothetical protein
VSNADLSQQPLAWCVVPGIDKSTGNAHLVFTQTEDVCHLRARRRCNKLLQSRNKRSPRGLSRDRYGHYRPSSVAPFCLGHIASKDKSSFKRFETAKR